MTEYAYDSHDNLVTVTDAEDQNTIYAYDDLARVVSAISPDTGLTLCSYDSAGNLISKTDARGNTVTYTYDALNRLKGIHFQDSTQDITYSYDEGPNGKGRLSGMVDPSGTYSHQYDELGRLVGEKKLIDGKEFALEYT